MNGQLITDDNNFNNQKRFINDPSGGESSELPLPYYTKDEVDILVEPDFKEWYGIIKKPQGVVISQGQNFTIGKRYVIQSYNAGDDFSNIGANNWTRSWFIATGTTPTDWTHNSYVTEDGVLTQTVIKNTLGVDLVFTQTGLSSYYIESEELFGDFDKVFATVSVGGVSERVFGFSGKYDTNQLEFQVQILSSGALVSAFRWSWVYLHLLIKK